MAVVGDESFHFDTTGDDSIRPHDSRSPATSKRAAHAPPDAKEPHKVAGLLLPSNVQFDESEVGNEVKSDEAAVIKEEDVIGEEERKLGHFVTLDRTAGQSRYYEAEAEEERRAQETCVTCGEKGHDKRSCTHELCLACGALDSHTTRECAQGLTCFRCGERGHKLSECTQRRKPGGRRWAQDCARCGSQNHLEANCPSHWRLYYYSDTQTVKAFRTERWSEYGRKQSKMPRTTVFDYRSDEDDERDVNPDGDGEQPPPEWDPAERWCYNCAARGTHWGDDCPERRCNLTRPTGEPSAYSEHLSRSGPYARMYAAPPPVAPARSTQRYGINGDLGARIGNFAAGKNASMHVVDDDDHDEPKSRRFSRQSNKERGNARLADRLAQEAKMRESARERLEMADKSGEQKKKRHFDEKSSKKQEHGGKKRKHKDQKEEKPQKKKHSSEKSSKHAKKLSAE